MDKTITIKNGDFTTDLNLAMIDRLTLKHWRELIVLAGNQLWDNAQAVQTTIDFLKEELHKADKSWREASRDYVDGYRDPKFIQQQKDKRAAETDNKKLMAKVKSTKHKRDLWEKRLRTITDRVPPDQLNYCLRAQK